MYAGPPGPPGRPVPLRFNSICSINVSGGALGPRRIPSPKPPRSKLQAPQKPHLSPPLPPRDISAGPPQPISLPHPCCMPPGQPNQVKTESHLVKVILSPPPIPSHTHMKLSRSPFKILKLGALNQTERNHRVFDRSGCSDEISLSKEIFGDYKLRLWHEQISSSKVKKNQ